MEDVERLKDKSGELLKASAVKHDHHKGGELVQIRCKASDLIKNANMSNNPRIEAGVISCNSVSAEFHKTWITDVINGKKIR